jgi:hypothetical protein
MALLSSADSDPAARAVGKRAEIHSLLRIQRRGVMFLTALLCSPVTGVREVLLLFSVAALKEGNYC